MFIFFVFVFLRAALDPQTFLEGGKKRIIGGKAMNSDVFLAKQSEEKKKKKKSRKRKRRGNPSE